MATSGGRRTPQKYPEELRERVVRMVLEVRRETDEARARLERTPRPEPVGPATWNSNKRLAGWLQWETSVGNGGRPTLDALHQRDTELEPVTHGRPRTSRDQVHQTIVDEMDGRDVQFG